MYYVSYKGQYEGLTFSNLGLNNKNAQIICPAYFRGSGTTQFESVMLINKGRGLIFIGSNSKGQIDFINPWKSKDIHVLHLL